MQLHLIGRGPYQSREGRQGTYHNCQVFCFHERCNPFPVFSHNTWQLCLTEDGLSRLSIRGAWRTGASLKQRGPLGGQGPGWTDKIAETHLQIT